METETKTHTPNKVRRRREREAAREARNEVRAIAKFVKAAPRKLRLVIDGIRGKATDEALNLLRFIPNRSAGIIEKVLVSAISNAENNMQMDSDKLYIHQAYVDGGPVVKRFRPRAMGRATPIRKKTSHITIIVKERGDEV